MKSFLVAFIAMPFIFIGIYIIIILKIRETKKIYADVKKNGFVYCYGITNDSLIYASNLDDINELNLYTDYYAKTLKGQKIKQNFHSSLFFSGGTYYYKISTQSKKLVDIYDIDTTCWGHQKFLIDKRLINKEPLPQHIQSRIDSVRNINPYKVRYKAVHNSPYGIQCEDFQLPKFLEFLTDIGIK